MKGSDEGALNKTTDICSREVACLVNHRVQKGLRARDGLRTAASAAAGSAFDEVLGYCAPILGERKRHLKVSFESPSSEEGSV